MNSRKITKSIVSLFLCIIMLTSVVPSTIITTYAYSTGDLNNDKKVNAIDAIILTQEILGGNTTNLAIQVSDLNHDDKVNSIDMNLLSMCILGTYVISDTKYSIDEVKLSGTDISDYSIVLPKEYPYGSFKENAEYAGELLTTYIKQACGIKLNVTESEAGNSIVFSYDESLGNDGFNVEVSSGEINVTCGLARGAMYAAYGILEEFFGYNFYTRDVIVIDEQSSVSIESGYTFTEGLNTPFTYRDVYTTSEYKKVVPDIHSSTYKLSYLAHHNTGMWDGNSWINNSKYGYVAGPDRNHSVRYYLAGKEQTSTGKYCFSTEDNVLQCISEVDKYVQTLINSGYIPGKNMPQISISMEDTSEWCQCKSCRKFVRNYTNSSSTLIYMINRVSQELTPKYEGIEFWTLAYLDSILAPVGMDIEDNIYICFAAINHCLKHAFLDPNCPANKTGVWGNVTILADWQKLTDNIHIWLYGLLFDMTAYYIPQLNWIYDSIVNMANAGVKGIFFQNEDTTLGITDLTVYLSSELMWNPDMTREEYLDLAKKFCIDYYGSETLYDMIMLFEDNPSNKCPICFSMNSGEWKISDESKMAAIYDDFYTLYDKAINEPDDSTKLSRFKRATTSMQFTIISESHQSRYVNGNAEIKKEYVERYQNMYNYMVEINGTFIFTVFNYPTAAKLPDSFDPSVAPRNWYS